MDGVRSFVARAMPAAFLLLAPAASWASPDGLAGPSPNPASAPAPAPGTTSPPRPATDPKKPDPLAAALAVADGVQAALRSAVDAVHASSVTVFNAKRVGGTDAEPAYQRQSGGSGVLISWKGKGPYVISNEHVVDGADRLEIVLHDGRRLYADVIDRVAKYDIALLGLAAPVPKDLKPAKIGKSTALKEGQWVLATGNPFFLAEDGCCVVTLGVVSGLDRTLRGKFTYANAIQHDTEVNPGNSGGPLWNLAGELVGINGLISTSGGGSTLGASNTGASYSIPIHLVTGYLDVLLSDKLAVAGSLGIDVVDSRDKTGAPAGAEIRAVRGASPLARGGKKDAPKAGDVITRLWLGPTTISLKSFDVACANDITNALAYYPAGSKVRVRYQRAGKSLEWLGELGAAE